MDLASLYIYIQEKLKWAKSITDGAYGTDRRILPDIANDVIRSFPPLSMHRRHAPMYGFIGPWLVDNVGQNAYTKRSKNQEDEKKKKVFYIQ